VARDDLKAGWLDKRSGDTSNLSALPVDSWKWQRRWFVLAYDAGYLYYFKGPEAMTSNVAPKVRGGERGGGERPCPLGMVRVCCGNAPSCESRGNAPNGKGPSGATV
jgi:hypothetical protein